RLLLTVSATRYGPVPEHAMRCGARCASASRSESAVARATSAKWEMDGTASVTQVSARRGGDHALLLAGAHEAECVRPVVGCRSEGDVLWVLDSEAKRRLEAESTRP